MFLRTSLFVPLLLALACLFMLPSCSGDDYICMNGDTDLVDSENGDSESESVELPEDIPVLNSSLPVVVTRDAAGDALTEAEVSDFTRTMGAFYKQIDYFRWVWRHSHGLANDNEWEQPGYKIWWTHGLAVKEGRHVTFRHLEGSDNTMAKMTRILPAIIGLYQSSDDALYRDLLLDYLHGFSATFDCMSWGEDDPVQEGIMARTFYHRNHSYELDDGRQVSIDYDPMRKVTEERRHSNVHNPNNPTYGDIYVRNRRSKDDFPYGYRMMIAIIRLIRTTTDDTVSEDAIRLYRQMRTLAKDIVEQGYKIRTKETNGEVWIPTMENGVTEDYASFVNFEDLFPNAECNAKLSTALLAEGEALENTCNDGDGGAYETAAINSQFWASNMIWGYHQTAVALSLALGDFEHTRKLLDGLIARLDGIRTDERAPGVPEWYPDLAQLLVLSAAYGVPLTAEEARIVMEQYSQATTHYLEFKSWDLWSDALPDGEYEYIPDRNTYDAQGEKEKSYVRPTEIVNLFEYCASPLKHPQGAVFIDCDILMDPARWGE